MTEHSNKRERQDREIWKHMRRTAGAYVLALAVLLLSSCQGLPESASSSAGPVSVSEEELALGDIRSTAETLMSRLRAVSRILQRRS